MICQTREEFAIKYVLICSNLRWKASLEALNSSSVCYVPGNIFSLHPLQITQGFPQDLHSCENPVGFHGIRDNPVIPLYLGNPVPVQTDPVEFFAIPIPSSASCEIPIPWKLQLSCEIWANPVQFYEN